MLLHEKNNSNSAPFSRRSTKAAQDFPHLSGTPINLRKKIDDQNRPSRRNPPRLGRLRPQIEEQELSRAFRTVSIADLDGPARTDTPALKLSPLTSAGRGLE